MNMLKLLPINVLILNLKIFFKFANIKCACISYLKFLIICIDKYCTLNTVHCTVCINHALLYSYVGWQQCLNPSC